MEDIGKTHRGTHSSILSQVVFSRYFIMIDPRYSAYKHYGENCPKLPKSIVRIDRKDKPYEFVLTGNIVLMSHWATGHECGTRIASASKSLNSLFDQEVGLVIIRYLQSRHHLQQFASIWQPRQHTSFS